MIKNFKSKKLKQFNSGDTSKVAQAHKKENRDYLKRFRYRYFNK